MKEAIAWIVVFVFVMWAILRAGKPSTGSGAEDRMETSMRGVVALVFCIVFVGVLILRVMAHYLGYYVTGHLPVTHHQHMAARGIYGL